MSETPQPHPYHVTVSGPDASTGSTLAADTSANKPLSVLEADAIEFIQAAARHAGEALPLLTGELGDGLTELLSKAKTLAAKHGFTL